MSTTPFNSPEFPGEDIPVRIGLAAATSIGAGQLVAINAAGNAIPASDTAAIKVVGRAEETVDNSAGAAGDLSILVKRGVFKYDNDATNPVDGASLMTFCYVKDSTTVDDTGGTNTIKAGLVVGVDTDGVWVDTRLAPAI